MKYQKGIACSLAALLLAVSLPFTAAAAIIGKGNTGTAVEAVQVVLKQEGYLSGACDGIFGSATETALKAYKRQKAFHRTESRRENACSNGPALRSFFHRRGKHY